MNRHRCAAGGCESAGPSAASDRGARGPSRPPGSGSGTRRDGRGRRLQRPHTHVLGILGAGPRPTPPRPRIRRREGSGVVRRPRRPGPTGTGALFTPPHYGNLRGRPRAPGRTTGPTASRGPAQGVRAGGGGPSARPLDPSRPCPSRGPEQARARLIRPTSPPSIGAQGERHRNGPRGHVDAWPPFTLNVWKTFLLREPVGAWSQGPGRGPGT